MITIEWFNKLHDVPIYVTNAGFNNWSNVCKTIGIIGKHNIVLKKVDKEWPLTKIIITVDDNNPLNQQKRRDFLSC